MIDIILSRRSIRKYTNMVVSEDDLQLILKAGFAAPSANNRQPWEFLVVRDKKLIADITNKHQYARMLNEAGCGIIVCGDMTKENKLAFLNNDCSAAIENMLLAIHALNLGGVWCAIHPNEDYEVFFKKLLNLPDNIIPIGLVVVGHKAEEKEPRDNYDEKKIHYDKW